MEFVVRTMTAADRGTWARMRAALWPDDTARDHAQAIDEMLATTPTGSCQTWGFVAETSAGIAAGFAEVAIRPYANGCDSRPVPFLEGIWIDAPFRRCRLGAQLMAHIEAFVVQRGFREIGSDALVDNHVSHAAHQAWGFSETERVVYFRKELAGRTVTLADRPRRRCPPLHRSRPGRCSSR